MTLGFQLEPMGAPESQQRRRGQSRCKRKQQAACVRSGLVASPAADFSV